MSAGIAPEVDTDEDGEAVAECIDCGGFCAPEDLDDAGRCDDCARAADDDT